MDLMDYEFDRADNPVDTVEQLAQLNDWPFERSDDEIALSVEGRWCDYRLSVTWMDDREALHLACAFDLKVPARRKIDVVRLLALVNERMWIGHFDVWDKDGVVIYRHSLPLPDGATATARQLAALIEAAIEASERYYQAFQFVVWAGKAPTEALEHALFETAGQA